MYVYYLLWEHIAEHAPLSDSQWGFQKRKSTVLSLLLATHEWHSLMDRQKDVMFSLIFRKPLILFLIID